MLEEVIDVWIVKEVGGILEEVRDHEEVVSVTGEVISD